MNEEQKRLLQRRLGDAVQQQPELRVLRRLLLKLGGLELVAPPSLDPATPQLVVEDFVMSGPVKLKVMGRSACHENMSRIWTMKKREIIAIGTGYALSKDGLWRQHSWGVRREGILETTEQREKYFGIFLQGIEADYFAASNQP